MEKLKMDKIVLKNLEKGEDLYNRGFSLMKWAMDRNKYELVEMGMRLMDEGLQSAKS